jgi:hypothetical protein
VRFHVPLFFRRSHCVCGGRFCLNTEPFLLRSRILLRAARIALDVTSFSFKKEVTKKVNLDVPSKTSLPPAVLQQTAGLLPCQNSSICGAYIPPRRWVYFGKDFCCPVLLEILSTTGCVAVGKSSCMTSCVRPSCSHFYVKMRAQKLNMLTFAKTLVARERQQFLRALGVSRGVPLDAFSSPILCGKAKNGQSHPRTRTQCCVSVPRSKQYKS